MAIQAAGDKDKKAEGEEVPQGFDDAFDEAIAEDKGDDEKPIDDDDDPGDEAKKEEPTSDKSEEEKAEEEELEKKPDVDPDSDPAKEKPIPDDDKDVETLEKVQHKYDTVSGMFNSEVKKRQAAEDELALLKEGKQPKPEDDLEKPKEEDPELDVATLAKTIGESESFKKLGDEYGEEMTTALTDMAGNIAKTVIGSLSKKVDGKLDEFSGIIDPLQKDHIKSADQTHFSALETAHPDYEKHRDSGELIEWIDTLPGYKQEMYKKVYEKGQTEDVIDLFSTFKDAKGYSATHPKKEEESVKKPEVEIDKKKLEDMEVIDRKNSPVSGVKGSAAKDDFEGAWDEA